jgi:hypothetical protein
LDALGLTPSGYEPPHSKHSSCYTVLFPFTGIKSRDILICLDPECKANHPEILGNEKALPRKPGRAMLYAFI